MGNVRLYSKNFFINNFWIFYYFLKRKFVVFYVIQDQELYFFFNSLAMYFEVGNNIIDSIEYSIHFIQNKEIFNSIIIDLKKGVSLSQSIIKTKAFPADIIFMIKSGEKNNALLKSFYTIKNMLELKIAKKKQLKNNLFYPIFVFFIFIFVLFLFSHYVIPSLISLLSENNPIFIKNMHYVNLLMIFIKYSIFIALFIVFFLCFLYFINNNFFFFIAIKFPFIGPLIVNYYFHFMFFSLSTSLDSGFSMIEACDILIESISIDYFQKILISTKSDLQKGLLFSDAVNYSCMPKFIIDILKSGEKIGKLINSLFLCCKIFEECYNDNVNSFINYLPVILICIISLLLSLFIYLLFLPIYTIGV